MQIKQLIDKLTDIYDTYGDIPIYTEQEYNDEYGCDYEIIDYMKDELAPVQIHIAEFTKEYYDYQLDDVVTEEYYEHIETPIGTRLPPDAKEVHIGLIL